MNSTIIFFAALIVSLSAFSDVEDTPLWLRYPAISPDGSTVAFAYQGDIYTVARSGGEARQITLHEAYESHPVWSPDGKSIAFASGRHGNPDIFITSADGGTPKRLTYHSSGDIPSAFTPDGKSVVFTSSRMDHHEAVLFPSGVLPELYSVSIDGEIPEQIITTPAERATFSPDGKKIIYHDRKGYEDKYRKHHVSSVTRDIWVYNLEEETYHKITDWEGEDRNPVYYAENKIYWLSERSGSFNVWKADISDNSIQGEKQVSNFDTHPVRSLTIADNGMICYSYNGEIYTQLDPNSPTKIDITLRKDRRYNTVEVKMINSDASEFIVSPNGKEIAFIVRGEVFVTAIDYDITKRITNTPEQERDLDFNSDGTKLLYSGERNESWSIYEASLGREEDKYFYNATVIDEKPVVSTLAETFQGRYSPNDEEVAFLEERTTLRIKNLKSGKIRTVMPGKYNYSYADGDQYFSWAPDSKWLLVEFFDNNRWNSQVGLLNASGKDEPINLTQSGYGNSRPKFGMDGEMVYYSSDKQGYRSHGSWGSQSDVYAIFLTEDAHKKFSLSKADYELWKEEQESEDDDKKEDEKKDKKKDDEEKKEIKPLKVDWEGLEDRKEKLTIFSSFLSDFLLDEEGEKLYYLTRTGEKFNLWKTNFKEKETKQFAELNGGGSELEFGKDEKEIFLNKNGSLVKVSLEDGSQKGVSFSSEMNLNADAERAYMFEHAWRQFEKKFYVEDLHGVDWKMYKANYERFLPHINNKTDFADMLSEMLGEVNASHTGGRAYTSSPKDDATAALGVFYDFDYEGSGLRIAEVIDESPLVKPDGKVKAGIIIEQINGNEIAPEENFYPLLNRKAGDKMLIAYRNPENGETWEDVVEPISLRAENQLLYKRWVESREKRALELSDGQLGYVHVRGMNSSSFREVYEKALGKHNTKKALIVDTRFNGGGWLHDDLATFLSGEPYMQFVPRGQDNMGGEPLGKWQKPSAVIMSESNYSDAHLFPYVYKYFDIGKLIGMPVPGTGTAVWWEQMLDGTVFGIPQIGMRDMKTGELVENKQLEPDIKVPNEPGKVSEGEDQQLQAAVKHLLSITE
ncbi:MAG TPA: S41 family peptidase [Cryomorphaceae bacterium]|nr:S41 family peptidase [Cryomorphaceae bacterium]